ELRIAIELALYKHRYELSMRRAKEIAEESNRLKGEFLANMSHELKTPLNSVIGFTQLALDLATDDEQREFLAMATGSAKSLLTLIEAILDFARMDAGKLVASPSPFSLDVVLEECADALAVGAYPKGLEVGLEREPGLRDSLIGDSQLLRRVLFNLIDNAVKFTDKGRVSLAVRSLPDGVGDSYSLAFSVSDSGIGMQPEKLELVFERFIQLDPSTTRKAGGTGLGLAIVRKAVELMAGSIDVESEPGRGTKFDVIFPFTVLDEPVRMPLPRLLEGRVVAIVGFDESGARDAALAAHELGAREIIARDIIARDYFADDLAALPPEAIVLVDERAVSRELGTFGAMKGRLVVATRYGSPARSRLEPAGEIAFTPLPFRVRRLAESLAALSILSADIARGAFAAGGGGLPRAGAEGGKVVVDEIARIYTDLAAGLESAMEQSDFEKAERLSMQTRQRFLAAASEEGEKLAFSAMLLARKGDAAALRQAGKRS
ncbi:MAG: ATP-binding protein, partial [Spirochaetaceae bacterium]|nr:ATP-binding protein [Spirochaetaceae bacterium]